MAAGQLPGLKPLVMMLGTGGVGKTTVSLAMAQALAERGKRTFLLTVDPARRLYDLAGKVRKKSPHLDIVQLDVGGHFAGLVRRHSPDEGTARRVLESRFFPYLTDHLPGFHEYVACDVILEALRSGRYDHVVVDTPPFAYALHFLEAPERLARMAGLASSVAGAAGGGKGLSPLLSKGLSMFLGGGFLGELLEFIGAFAKVWPGIEATALEVSRLYRESTSFCAVVVADGRSTEDFVAFVSQAPAWLGVQFLIINRAWEGEGVYDGPSTRSALESTLEALPFCADVSPVSRRVLAHSLAEAKELGDTMRRNQTLAMERVANLRPELMKSGALVLPQIPGGIGNQLALEWLSGRLWEELTGALAAQTDRG